MNLRALSLLPVCALLAACQSAPAPAPTPVDKAAPAPAVPVSWLRTELYFGIAPADAEGLGLSAAQGSWQSFVDEEVTPRFPDGFTVFDAYGQWRADEQSEPGRILSRVLVIVHPDTPAKRAGIEAIREAYCQRTGSKSVLAVETPVRDFRF